MNITVSMINPGGNITLLVKGIFEKNLRKDLNSKLLKMFPDAEQVGFYEDNRLNMAGDEFCGNAVRSLSYLILNKDTHSTQIEIVNKKIQTGFDNKNIYTEIPIYSSFFKIRELEENLYQVEIKGITHLISEKNSIYTSEEYKKIAKDILQKYNLLQNTPAAGVMFINQTTDPNIIQLNPVVWVRDVETLFFETACGSGTTAIGLWKARKEKTFTNTYFVKQPSNTIFSTTIIKNNQKFISAKIAGPVTSIFRDQLIQI